jgi:hypothetical protein
MTNNDILHSVPEKIADVLIDNEKIGNDFYKRWGIPPNQYVAKIRSNELHGGFESKLKSISNLVVHPNMTIMNIGPEMGIESFMMAELADKVYVCDPDSTILKLVNDIACQYICENGEKSSKKMEFLHAGFKIDEVNSKDREQYKSINSILNHALPTYYDVDSTKEIESLSFKVDIVFIHKILTTLTRFSPPNSDLDIVSYIIDVLADKLNSHGIISWTEPSFVWEKYLLKNKKIYNQLLAHSTRKSYRLTHCDDIYNQYIFSKIS